MRHASSHLIIGHELSILHVTRPPNKHKPKNLDKVSKSKPSRANDRKRKKKKKKNRCLSDEKISLIFAPHQKKKKKENKRKNPIQILPFIQTCFPQPKKPPFLQPPKKISQLPSPIFYIRPSNQPTYQPTIQVSSPQNPCLSRQRPGRINSPAEEWMVRAVDAAGTFVVRFVRRMKQAVATHSSYPAAVVGADDPLVLHPHVHYSRVSQQVGSWPRGGEVIGLLLLLPP